MTSNPLSIVKPKPDPVVIERIETLLEMAKNGEVTGFAAITIHLDNCIGDCYAGSCNQNVYRTIGALETLKARFIAECVELQ